MKNSDTVREICDGNLRSLACLFPDRLREGEVWLAEYAAAVLAEGADAARLGPELLPPALTDPALPALLREGWLCGYTRALYRTFCRAMPQHPLDFAALLGDGEEERRRTVYVRTPAADGVYTRFSRAFHDCTVSYADTFEQACGQVYTEQADFAILPLWDSGGEIVRTTRALTEKYELCVNAAYRTGQEHGAVLALLSRTPLGLGRNCGGMYFSCILHPDEAGETAALLSAAAAFGCEIRRAEMLQGDYDRRRMHMTFYGENNLLLLLWLTLVGCPFRVCGLFSLTE